jgi:ribosomal protein L40E
MVKRYCLKCNAEFNRKSHYDYHINKKFDCTPKNDTTSENINNLKICKKCA